jgi:hypothetical protein
MHGRCILQDSSDIPSWDYIVLDQRYQERLANGQRRVTRSDSRIVNIIVHGVLLWEGWGLKLGSHCTVPHFTSSVPNLG